MTKEDIQIYDISERFKPAFLRTRISSIVGITERIKKGEAQAYKQRTGRDFALFQRGELDISPPDFIIDKTYEGQKLGYVRYPKSGGELFLKDAILANLESKGIKGLTPKNIIITYGGQGGLQLSHGLFEGAKEIGFGSTWSCMLDNMIPYSNIDFDEVPLEEINGAVTFDESKLERKLKDSSLVYLNTPQNPSGKVFSREEMEKIDHLARKNNNLIISDEAYQDIVYDGREHVSSLEFNNPNTISVFTFSKSFAATGYRIGFTVCRNEKIIEEMTKGEYTQTAGVVPFIQYAFSEALKNAEFMNGWISKLSPMLQKRRDTAFDVLKDSIPSIRKPEGAFYYFIDLNPFIPGGIENKDDYVLEKFLSKGVAIVPGSAFGKNYEGFVRLSYSGMNDQQVEEGCNRVVEVIDELKEAA
jgi:aspartate aminotransferase